MTFTRSQFDEACKKFIQNHGHHVLDKGKPSWSWREHACLLGFGYMERVTSLPLHRRVTGINADTIQDNLEENSLEPIDCAAAAATFAGELLCHQYVVLSPTFRVPTFYFSVHDSSGTPLTLTEVLQLPLFHRDAFEGAQVTTFSVEQSCASFPLLSFGDHPTLNVQCWYLHPCGTKAAVEEILDATEEGNAEEEQCHLRWLEAWFTVLSSLLDLRR
ncbi:hypothetical protein EDD16DRAFT_941768 [Pisolithus croceorrhizus]|nr:hypothetical protein F5141DRAFT_141548 [Pisolithus sp. B1]KAI6119416.1 hypothetical protein EDD16DRAFT_941768 [Pisolithus croceorrhizus]